MSYRKLSLLIFFITCSAFLTLSNAATTTPTPADSAKAKAISTMDDLESYQRYVDAISPTDLTELPVGLKKKFGSASVTIGVSQAKFMPGYTQLTVFCKLTLPQKDPETNKSKEIYFGADNIKLSHGGGLIGEARLYLLQDAKLPFGGNAVSVVLKGATNVKVPDPQSNTYATLTCNGIKEISLSADILFSRSLLVPLNQKLEVDSTKQVTASFKTVISDWNDILAEVSLPSFAVKGMEKFAFSVDKAVVDMSDTRNSSDVSFPKNYTNLVSGQEKLWRGVYINKLKVTLPPEFKRKGSTERPTIEGSNMLIDDAGFTGSVSASNVLPDGSAGGWTFSVDKFALSVEANKLTAGSFEGRIVLPVSKEQNGDSCQGGVGYKATISGNEYSMRVNSLCDVNFDMFQAKAHLNPNSYLEIAVKNGSFRPKAVLNGSLTISPTKTSASEAAGGKEFGAFGIEFQDLVLQTEAPFIQVGYMGYKGDVRLGNFPVTLSDIGIRTTNSEVALSMGVGVNLMEGKISGKTKLSFVGAMQTENETTAFVFKRVDIGAITVDKADFGAFSISGTASFLRNDPVMGNGFAGDMTLNLNISKKLEIKAQVAFGSKIDATEASSSFRYWYIQSMASGFSIPVATGFYITGLGGGACYHMKKTASESSQSLCGIDYTPDKSIGLGFNAKVNFEGGKAFKGDAGFEIMFTSSMGLSYMGFYGKAYFSPPASISNFYSDVANAKNYLGEQMKKTLTNIQNSPAYKTLASNGKFADMANNIQPVNTKLDGEATMMATIGISFDFTNSTLHATAEAYIKTPGNIIRGAGQNNKAGWIVLHFTPDEWYVHIGTPTDRIGLKVGIGGLSAEASGYFMVGTRIPGSPAPPAQVAQILGKDAQSLDYMRDLNALGDGKGFAFGASLQVSTGDLRFLMFYASFSAGVGFDIMLKDYGDAHCEGSSSPIGMNGWYANGQAYAYLQGELGIQVKLLFIKKRIPIVSAGAAVLLQAKLPNPSWFSGQLGGYFSVLGGLIKGRFSFKITLGEECKIVTGSDSPLDDIKVISEITPADRSTQVDVFTTPQAVFNMSVNKEFALENGSLYRVKLNSFTVTKDGVAIRGALKWNNDNNAVMFQSDEILPPNTSLKALAIVGFEQKNGGSWQTVYENGKLVSEQQEILFTTGPAPDYIPEKNIAYCYPVKDQKYFFPLEYRQAYLQLKQGQEYLFTDAQYTPQVWFSNNGAITRSAFTYDAGAKRVIVSLPELKTSQPYTLALVGVPQTTNTENVKQVASSVTTGDTEITTTSNKATGTLTSDEARTYLQYDFATSQYYSFRDKMAAKTLIKGQYQIISTFVGALHADVAGSEAFDAADLWGSNLSDNKPLIQASALLTDSWYTQYIYPRIYKQYPPEPGITLSRDTSVVGFPPTRGVEVASWYQPTLQNSPNDQSLVTRLPYRYYQDYYYFSDYREFQNKLINKYANNFSLMPEPLRQTYLEGIYPIMRTGKYPVLFRYVLPGNVQSNQVQFEYDNPF